MRLRLWLAVGLLLSVLAAGTASALNVQRHENRYWVWYAPHGWVDTHSANGIDISSPTGTFIVSFGFAPTPGPVSFRQVRQLLLDTDSLDLHPLRKDHFTDIGRPFSFAGGQRQVAEWAAIRRDRGEHVRGVVKIDIFNNPAAGTYFFEAGNYGAPRGSFQRIEPTLKFVLGHIVYKPR
jgi:hypothetical protein